MSPKSLPKPKAERPVGKQTFEAIRDRDSRRAHEAAHVLEEVRWVLDHVLQEDVCVLRLLSVVLREVVVLHVALEARGALSPTFSVAREREEPVPLLQLVEHGDDGPVGVYGRPPLEEFASGRVRVEKDERSAEVLEVHDIT